VNLSIGRTKRERSMRETHDADCSRSHIDRPNSHTHDLEASFDRSSQTPWRCQKNEDPDLGATMEK
jgi:hypothetical protein